MFFERLSFVSVSSFLITCTADNLSHPFSSRLPNVTSFQVSSSLLYPSIVTLMWSWQGCSLHRHLHKRSVNNLALPNDAKLDGFLDIQVCLRVQFMSSVRFEDLKVHRKLIVMRCMCFCTGYRAAGRTQTDKIRPHRL